MDKDYEKNIGYALQGNVSLQDRALAFFSDSTYAVLYDEDKLHVWYYDKNGKLIVESGKGSYFKTDYVELIWFYQIFDNFSLLGEFSDD